MVWSNSYTKFVSTGQFSVAMVNHTVKYECALNFCVVNILHSSEMLLYAVVKETTDEGWDDRICNVFNCVLEIG